MKLSSCHPNRKHKAHRLCGPCYEKWLKENNLQYKKNQRISCTKWQRLNPEKRKEAMRKREERRRADPLDKIKKRERMLKKKYGIVNADYDHMLLEQNGSCALCTRRPAEGKYLHVDHCHKTGNIRGLLCHQCNWYLGTIEEDPKIIDRIINYLKK